VAADRPDRQDAAAAMTENGLIVIKFVARTQAEAAEGRGKPEDPTLLVAEVW